MSVLNELNRRNVFRVAVAYAVTAWLLIQIAETIFPLFGFDETPARIVVVVLAVGFIPALVFAWAFEITPEGVKREAEVDRSSPLVLQTGKKLDRLIALLLALALGYFAFDKFVLDPERDAALVEETVQQVRADALVQAYGENSIAVLPFANLSNDPEQEYFSDGMAEELLNLLARVPRLRVISRSSSFAFKGQAINVPTIARQLGVNHVIEGSVRRHGDRLRITAQLIDARSDTHLWSQTYERRLEDVFAIQDEISSAIVAALGEKLGLDGGATQLRAPVNTAAYEAYLRGRHLMAQRSSEALAGAAAEFRKAVALDPDYALGYASLVIALALRGGSPDLTVEESIVQGRPYAERAFQLDPNLAEAHAALGWVNFQPNSMAQAEAHFRRAIELNPGYAEAHMWLGHFLLNRTDYAGSFVLYQRAEQLDPLSIPAKNNLFAALVARGQLDEASALLETMTSLNPDGSLYWLAYLKSIGGNWADGALANLDAVRSPSPYGPWAYADLMVQLALMGMEREALVDPAALGRGSGPPTESAPGPARVLSSLGRPAEAVTAWERLPGGIPREQEPGYLSAGVLLAAAGDFARAEPMLERAWQMFYRSAGIAYPSRDANFVLALLFVRRQRGDEDGVSEVTVALQDAVRRYAEAGLVVCDVDAGCVHFDAGISAYLDGDREQGLALIAKSIESGYFVPANHAYLKFLYDDPGFGAILEQQAARRARQRGNFLAVVCFDNPYAEIWRPLADTCSETR